MTHDALIYIFTGTIGLGCISLRAGAITDTTGNRYALGTTWTLFALRASGQHAFTVDNLIRRLTLTFDAITFFTK